MRDITVMDNPIDKLPPEGGYYAALLLALAGVIKAALPWLRSRDAAQAKLTKEERDAARAEERDLVVTLKARLELVEGEVKQLRDERVADKVMIASLTAKFDHAQAEIARKDAELARKDADLDRVRGEREHYRMIAETATDAVQAADPRAAQQLDDEISEADEATSQAGSKLP